MSHWNKWYNPKIFERSNKFVDTSIHIKVGNFLRLHHFYVKVICKYVFHLFKIVSTLIQFLFFARIWNNHFTILPWVFNVCFLHSFDKNRLHTRRKMWGFSFLKNAHIAYFSLSYFSRELRWITQIIKDSILLIIWCCFQQSLIAN